MYKRQVHASLEQLGGVRVAQIVETHCDALLCLGKPGLRLRWEADDHSAFWPYKTEQG